MIFSLKPGKVLAPIEPLLILPEVLDTRAYWDGKLPWRDKDKLTMAVLAYPFPSIFINTNLVKPEEITSYPNLLNPKWKGKIIMLDPIRPGAANQWVFMMGERFLGWDFIRELVKQELRIHVDQPIMAQWLAQGKYPISIGVASEHILPLKDAGAAIRLVHTKEGTFLTSGSFAFSVIENAPHPNSAKLFANWVLSKEGQIILARIVRQHVVRNDVPTKTLIPEFMRQADVKYLTADDEESNLKRQESMELIRKIFEPYWK